MLSCSNSIICITNWQVCSSSYTRQHRGAFGNILLFSALIPHNIKMPLSNHAFAWQWVAKKIQPWNMHSHHSKFQVSYFSYPFDPVCWVKFFMPFSVSPPEMTNSLDVSQELNREIIEKWTVIYQNIFSSSKSLLFSSILLHINKHKLSTTTCWSKELLIYYA